LSGEHKVEDNGNISITEIQSTQSTYQKLMAEGEQRFHAKLRQSKGPLGWAMSVLHNNPIGAGEIYEFRNMVIIIKRIPAMIVAGALYGMHYDIHAAQTGVSGTPEGARMQRVYSHAKKYPNEVEYGYSFI
jgi:sodium-dependent phosphate transporter